MRVHIMYSDIELPGVHLANLLIHIRSQSKSEAVLLKAEGYLKSACPQKTEVDSCLHI